MSEVNKLEVNIQGRAYTLRAAENDEYIYKIAAYVDRKLGEIAAMNSRLSMDMTAVLGAVNIADEYFKVLQLEDNLRAQVLQYAEDIRKAEEKIRKLEAQVKGK